ncbi:MAG: HflX-like GTP-binding protein [Candidatus Kariarchaeaceae archaeon]|jgi:GTP-binding protein HflX
MRAAVIDNRVNRVDTERREIIELAEAAGYKVVVHYEVQLDPPHPRNYLPEMKMETFKMMIAEEEIDKVIVAQPLRAHQVGTLKDILEIETIDKPSLVLEIFEKKANSVDIQLQIQLAQLKYTLPQVTSQLGQAVRGEREGFGGGGEQVTNVAVSDIRSRMRTIETKLKEYKKEPSTQDDTIPRIPIVGYYSAGKSTLFNILTSSDRETGAEAFTTMIMKTQRSEVTGYPIDLVDTVGLVDLPTNILSAFELMLSQIFAYSGMILCLSSDLPFDQWKSQLADFEEYIERFTKTPPRILIALTKTDKADPISLSDMRDHLSTVEWITEYEVILTRSDDTVLTQNRFIEAFETLFSDRLTEFYYQHLNPSVASKIHNVARINDQEWHDDGTTSLAGIGPTELLDVLKGEIFS